MKKKALLASALALALMVSPLGGLRASAEESGVSLAAATDSASSVKPLTDPTNARFTGDYNCAVDWSGSSNYTKGTLWWHIKVYKDGQLYKEYKGNDRDPYTVPADITGTLTFPFSHDLKDSGTYCFEIRVERDTSKGFYASHWISSDEVTYTRPEKTLGTTVGSWSTEKEGLLLFESVEGASGYQWQLQKLDENSGEWAECTGRGYNQSIEGLVWDGNISYTYITPETTPDAAGQVKERDFSREVKAYGPGSYRVAIKALSGRLDEVVDGAEVYSEELKTGGNSGYDQAGDDSDSGQSDDSSPLEEKVEAAAPGEVIKMQGITTLSNADMKLLLENKVTLEMEYTYEGVDYKVRIPAGTAMDNDIPWYGPLYLAKYYSVNSLGAGMTGPTYTVQKGDTLGKIARANNMTVAELAAKNPQITNVNVIIQGQTIKIK